MGKIQTCGAFWKLDCFFLGLRALLALYVLAAVAGLDIFLVFLLSLLSLLSPHSLLSLLSLLSPLFLLSTLLLLSLSLQNPFPFLSLVDRRRPGARIEGLLSDAPI